jgi:hypothetical protein
MADTNATSTAQVAGSEVGSAPAVSAAPPAVPVSPAITSEQLAQAQDQARAKARQDLLAELGYHDEAEAKAARDAQRKAEEAQKTELQRLTEAAAKLEPVSAEAKRYRAAVEAHLAAEIAALPEAKRALVDDLGPAATDPAARLDWLSRAKAKGLFAEAKTPGAAAPGPPATTMAPSGPATQPGQAPSEYEHWQSLVRSGKPTMAAQYYQLHAKAIEAQRPRPSA